MHLFQILPERIYKNHGDITDDTLYFILYTLAYDRKFKMTFNFDYYLLSPHLNTTVIDRSSHLSSKTYIFKTYHSLTQLPFITFQRHETRLLPPPHDTQCMDYRRAGLESQLHCSHECIKHESARTLHLVPTDVSIFHLNEMGVPLFSSDQMQNVSIMESLFLIRNLCHEKCFKPNCKRRALQALQSNFRIQFLLHQPLTIASF